jgi:hypothetical protein
VSAKSPTLEVAISNDTSDLCVTLRKFIASRDKSDSESTTKKNHLMIFFEYIAQTMVKSPEVDLAETKRDIFNILLTTIQWRTEEGFGGSNPPKFRNFDEVEPDCKLSRKCLVFPIQYLN